VNVFICLGTQWRVGAGGATGLDYGVIGPVLDLMGVAPTDRDELFEALRVMEDAALATMTKRLDAIRRAQGAR
jgi:hypothetical protein